MKKKYRWSTSMGRLRADGFGPAGVPPSRTTASLNPLVVGSTSTRWRAVAASATEIGLGSGPSSVTMPSTSTAPGVSVAEASTSFPSGWSCVTSALLLDGIVGEPAERVEQRELGRLDGAMLAD